MALLSPGVEIKEIDASTIVPTVSDSTGVFCGEFDQGPINDRILITNPDDLVKIFGKPTDKNYNQFFQAFNFLQYQNTLYVVRAKHLYKDDGEPTPTIESQPQYSQNYGINSANREILSIDNQVEFESKTIPLDAGLKIAFIQSTPGDWGNDIQIQIQKPSDFESGKYAFEGISLDSLFEYYPDQAVDGEFGIQIKYGDEIESFIVNLNKDGKDTNNKSTFVETVINRQSNFVYVKIDSSLENITDLPDQLYDDQSPPQITPIELNYGQNGFGTPLLDDAYNLFDNKEEIDVDIIIGNEVDDARSQINLANFRKDCIAFYGAPNSNDEQVGKKSTVAVQNVIDWRKGSSFNHNTMFQCVQGNYKYQYDRFNDKNRWINLAGDIQGLRAQTNTTNQSWWASAGLDRGQIKNVLKLAFVPNQPQRDQLYKASVNPVTTFPGLGTVMWGQKTLQTKPSSFDRVNVRGLFNTIERALSVMSRYQVFEFNDEFTRNRIVQMIRPFLETVQAGRGIQDFLVVCDTSNNTPDIISRNQLIVDVYIKPTYVQEFITLRFTNQGVNDFSTIVSGG